MTIRHQALAGGALCLLALAMRATGTTDLWPCLLALCIAGGCVWMARA